MQKNWYIIYTKPKFEKKVSNFLTKKKIENFCPEITREIPYLRRYKTVSEALFDSYVFVRIEAEKIHTLLHYENIINVVYWKNELAIVSEEEIEVMKRLSHSEAQIILHKSKVNPMERFSPWEKPSYSIDGNLLLVKSLGIKINLPSIGYILEVKTQNQSIFTFDNIKTKDFLLQ